MSHTISYPELHEARRGQIIIASLAFVATMDTNVVSLLLEPIKHDLGLSDVQVGIANSSALYGAYALLSIPMGLLADRTSRVRMLISAAILWCVGLVITGFSHSLGMLVMGKTILGVANAITAPASLSLLSDYFAPDRRGMAMSSYGVGQVTGGAAAIIVGGFGLSLLTDISVNDPGALFGIAPWRCVSLFFGVVIFVMLPWLITMREPARQDVKDRTSNIVSELWNFRGLLFPLIAGQAFVAGAAIGIMNWIPVALQRIYGLETSAFAGWYSALSLTAGVIGLVAAGKLVQTLHSTRVRLTLFAAGAALVSAITSSMALMPSPRLFGLMFLLFNIAYTLAAGIAVILIGYRIPNELRGAAISLSAVGVSIAGAAGAPLMAWVSDSFGGGSAIGTGMAAIGAGGGLLSMLSFLSAKRSDASPEFTPTQAST